MWKNVKEMVDILAVVSGRFMHLKFTDFDARVGEPRAPNQNWERKAILSLGLSQEAGRAIVWEGKAWKKT